MPECDTCKRYKKTKHAKNNKNFNGECFHTHIMNYGKLGGQQTVMIPI